MTNIFDLLKEIVEDLTNKTEDKSPMHTGEVTNLWLYVTMLEEANRYVEMALNTTIDKELIEILQQAFKECANQIQEITKFFINEGITIPPTSEAKPKSDSNSVPLGVKMTDDEIANGLSIKQAAA